MNDNTHEKDPVVVMFINPPIKTTTMGRKLGSKNKIKGEDKVYVPKVSRRKLFKLPIQHEKPKFTIDLGVGQQFTDTDGNVQTFYPDAQLVKTV